MNCSTVGGVIRSAGGESNNPFSSIFHFSKPLDWLGNKARRAVCAQQQRKILTVIKATSKCRGPRMAQNLIHVTWRMDRVCTPMDEFFGLSRTRAGVSVMQKLSNMTRVYASSGTSLSPNVLQVPR